MGSRERESLLSYKTCFTTPVDHSIKNIAVIRLSIIYCYYKRRIK